MLCFRDDNIDIDNAVEDLIALENPEFHRQVLEAIEESYDPHEFSIRNENTFRFNPFV